MLGAAEAHRLRDVLRLQAGDRIALFNGSDGEFSATIGTLARGRAVIAVGERRRPPEASADLWLVFAPIKRTHLEFLIEKATELGATALVPVLTAHTAVPRLNPAHLEAISRAAAEQCERLSLPALRSLQKLPDLLASWDPARALVLCDETGTAPPAATALAALAPGPRAVLVGPEGGFAESELDALRKLPFVCPVGLGPRLLRSDTAALAGLAVVQAIGGDWAAPRSMHLHGREAASSS